MSITPGAWLLALLPIAALLVALLALRLSAPVAGAVAWITAGLCSLLFFGGSGFLLLVASAKGLSLSLFVLLIVWAALLLYNFMHHLGAVDVIARSLARLSRDSATQALLLGWVFSGFIEGIAGFGVPVVVVAPFLVRLGFSPVKAVALVLVGHSWAVTYGALGSAYYAIQLVTGIAASEIGPVMALLFAVPIFGAGLAVAHIEGGWPGLRRNTATILVVGAAMSASLWVTAYLGVAQVAALVAGLAGSAAMGLLGGISGRQILAGQPALAGPSRPSDRLSFHRAFLPYYLLISVAILSQLPPVKQATAHLYLAFSYPGLATAYGYAVAPVKDYARINLLGHPAPMILTSIIVTAAVFRWKRQWKSGVTMAAIKATFGQSWSASLGIATMVMMALIMNDSGMTNVLALGIAATTGAIFPLLSPYIGVLGCFMTGSNTNSNVMFGSLQVNTARSLGISPSVIASAQSIGGSLGSSIAPAKVMMGCGAVGLGGGEENQVLRKTLVYCFLLAFLVGLEAWLAARILAP